MPVWISASALAVTLPVPVFFCLFSVCWWSSHSPVQLRSLTHWQAGSAHLQVGGYSGVGGAVTGLR